jgi:hypothetical protein
MNLEWFWVQVSEVDQSAAIGIALVSIFATIVIVLCSRNSSPVVPDTAAMSWQIAIIERFRAQLSQVNNWGRLTVGYRSHPQFLMEYLDVYMIVDGKPAIVIAVEVSRSQRNDRAILVKHGGKERYFSPHEFGEALQYFRQVFKEMAAA